MHKFRSIFLVVCHLASFVAGASALTLEELQNSFQASRLRVEHEGATKLSELRQKYVAALSKIKGKHQKAGNLNHALATKAEIEQVESNAWPMKPLEKKAPTDLISARSIFFKAYLGFQKESSQELVDLADKMDKLLAAQIVANTKAGVLEDAQRAKNYQTDLKNDEGVKTARALVERVRNDGSAPIALRVRRTGDHLEVLVRYDSSGKISPQSKVENVKELTGGKTELGDTKATTLGEFIGSKGFEVDPYSVLDKTFDDKELAPQMHATDLKVEFMKKDGGELGARFISIANPKNTHVSFGYRLPDLTEKGTFRVKIRYFVPGSNQVTEGFKLIQGEGGPIPGGATGAKKGEWLTHEFTSAGVGKSKMMLFYPAYKKESKGIQNPGDYISIGAATVEHIKFSAYIVERYDRDGAVAESFPDVGKQIPMAANGAVLPTN